MFNKNDYLTDDILQKIYQDCTIAAKNIVNPKNYFQGIPNTQLHIPDNILLFFRGKKIVTERPSLHHRFMIIFNLAGDGSVIIDSKLFHLKKGNAILVHPHQFHLYADMQNENIAWVFMTFELENQKAILGHKNKIINLSQYSIYTLSLLIQTYNSIPQKSTLNERLLFASILSEILNATEIEPNQNDSKNINTNETMLMVQKVVAFVHQNLDSVILIDDIAKHIHVSESHLRKLFKSTMKIGLGTYIRQTKVHKASFLIKNTNLSFSQIADRCGFSSLFSFSRTFHKEVKLSPTTYKLKEKNIADQKL